MSARRATRAGLFAFLCIVGPVGRAAPADEAAVVAHFRAAQQATQNGNIELAVNEYETVLRLDPSVVEAHVNLGLAYHMLGQYELAIIELAGALRRNPKVLGANVVLGVDYLKVGQPEKAVLPLKAALAMDPGNVQAGRALTDYYLAGNDYFHAAEEFRKLFSLEPNKEEAWFGLGHDYLRMSQQLTARMAAESWNTAWRHRLAGDALADRHLWNDAAREYRNALTLQPGLSGLHASLGQALLYGSSRDQAEDEFHNELRLDTNSVEALLGLTSLALARGEARGALDSVAKVVTISPDFIAHLDDIPGPDVAAGVWGKLAAELEAAAPTPARAFLLAAAYQALGETGKAAEQQRSFRSQIAAVEAGRTRVANRACASHDYTVCIRDLRSKNSLTPGDRLTLGRAHFALGQFDKAADAFATAQALTSRNAAPNLEPAYWLIRTYTALSDNCFIQLMARSPDSWRAHQLKAEGDRLRQADKDAITEYEAAARLQPDDFELHRALGELYLSAGSPETARTEIEKALGLNAADGRTLYLMGRWYTTQRQPENGIPYLQRALRIEPGLLEARASLGSAYLHTGKASLAAPELEKAVPLDRYGNLHYMLYQAYRDLGKKDLAEKALAQSQYLRGKSASDDQAKIEHAEEE